jgi:hypothetical protein
LGADLAQKVFWRWGRRGRRRARRRSMKRKGGVGREKEEEVEEEEGLMDRKGKGRSEKELRFLGIVCTWLLSALSYVVADF